MNRLLFTPGDIARKINLSPARIAYTIAKYNLPHTARCGIIRLYSEEQARTIEQLARSVRGKGHVE